MQKVYLLLRNNQQTGPFSLEELTRFDLKPFDLIWIEGKSAGWYYPQEITALHPYLSFMKQTASQPAPANPVETTTKSAINTQAKKVFVSMPSYTKEEPTPKPSFKSSSVQDETPKFSEPVGPTKEAEELSTSYTKSLQDVETDYMNWVYQKKTKKKGRISLKGAVAACLIVGVAFGAWWVMKPYTNSPGKTPPEQTAFFQPENELPVDSATASETVIEKNKSAAVKKIRQNNAAAKEKQTATVVKARPSKKVPEEIVVNTGAVESNDYGTTPPVVKEADKLVIEEKKEPVTAETPKEKKKLRDKIFDIFRKKPEEKKEDAKPVEEENGQRNSTRRETGSSLAQMVTVKFAVPNDWMMGIKGAKATLTNRSSEAIVKAVVEVQYYNDDNELLDKKTISFSGIKSKQSQTIAVPDHATATRLEYNVVSATGANEPFAKM